MRASLKSRPFRLLASSVSLRTSPFACLSEVTTISCGCFLSQSEDMLHCVPFRCHSCFLCLLPHSVIGHAPLRAISKSRQFRLFASPVSLRTCPFACLSEFTSVSIACFHRLSEDKPLCVPFQCLFVSFACFLSRSEDKPLCVPFRSHVCSDCLRPLSV